MNSPHLVTLDASAPTADLVGALEEHGVAVVRDLLSADQLARFNAELDPLLKVAAPDHDNAFVNDDLAGFFGSRTRHVLGVAAKSEVFATEVLAHPLLLAVCDAVLLPSCARYQLNLAHVIDRGPQAQGQRMHRDDEGWDVYLPQPHPELQVASVIALADFTRDNGATVVVPGSHRWERTRTAAPEEQVTVEMPAGSAVVFLGSTLHAGGGNTTTDQWRRGMQVSYALGWLRMEENHCLSTPPAVARTLPRTAQELLGYAAHDAVDRQAGTLGHVDLRHPVDLLAEGRL